MTTFEHLLAPHLPALEVHLLALASCQPPASQLAPVDGSAVLAEMTRQPLATGGKRLRGALPMAMVAAEQGPLAAALELGACLELIHNGTLVHDDLQDGDRLRRGQPTLWTVVGVAQAVNAGDAMLVAPLARLARSQALPAELRAPLTALVADALLETLAGQVADLAVHGRAATLAELRAVHMGKTAPLFGACVAGAALLLGRSIDASGLAADLGLAFQIRDDLLDVLGRKGRGLPGADLREGKPTWPLLRAGLELPTACDDQAVAAIVADLHDRGAVAATEADLAELLAKVRSAAVDLLPPGAAAVVCALADRLAEIDG
jgi:geranylgeranyl pyrophosphate synthase